MIKKNGGKPMAVSYDKLWVILNEREMMKTDLIRYIPHGGGLF